MALVTQPTKTPTRKVLIGFIGSLLVAVASGIVTAAASVHIPPGILTGALIVGSALPAWLAKETATPTGPQ